MNTLKYCEYELRNNIAILYLNHGPVNALSFAIREEIYNFLYQQATEQTMQAVVLTTRQLPFSAGADIKEFSGPMRGKFFLDFYAAIKKLNKPVICGIRQYALGGGLELAMLCHYRVAAVDARMGLPELKLGLIPGGTGTMSLPRLVGVEKAADMILTSKAISAEQGYKQGLVDALASDDLITACIDFAKSKLSQSTKHTLPLHRANPDLPAPDYFAKMHQAVKERSPGFQAPLRLLNCLEASTQMPIESGLAFEMQQFKELITGPDSAGMRYAFLSERVSAHIPGLDTTEQISVERVGIVGGGLMGSGIAMAFLQRGFQVCCLEVSQERADLCLKTVQDYFSQKQAQQKITQSRLHEIMQRFHVTMKITDFAQFDLVIEAVFENLKLKCDLLKELDQVCAEKTILATNTSGLNIKKMAACTKRPDRVLGLHFFSPAQVMRLVEIVRTEHTSAVVLTSSLAVIKQLKKIPVTVNVCPGFVGNRMIFKYFHQVVYLLLRGCAPERIDRVMRRFGFPMGPCEMADMSGLDIWVHASTEKDTLVHYFVKSGRLGQKSGGGFYDYSKQSRKPVVSKDAIALINAYAQQHGVPAHAIQDAEIERSLLCALINEGLHILEEKVALRASDIDTIYVHGYGFPVYHGGPMFYADQLGLALVKEQLEQCALACPEQWSISPLLEQCISAGKKLHKLQS